MRTKVKPQLLDPTAAAEFLGLASKGVLAVWRSEKRYDLPYVKIGRLIWYDIDDLLNFLESRKVRPMGQTARPGESLAAI